ncbi:MAG: class I SAM-dependent methyltransferase [Acidimicrobiales bacterium]|nr:class I SAM-dependent methyltransferase [Acidimicrobiales bacterium]MCB9393874.1 class I SAM-dependent methyltransferase [Acidimicrobiaceae bacterium]
MGDRDPWGEATAASYDADDAEMFSPSVLGPTVDFLAHLAGGRRALEFAAGTGRVTLPLAATGVDVAAIELSEAMAARLRAKPGAERIELVVGDMATTRVPGEFGLVYLVYNTISNLLTQDEQVACFANAAAHLVPGGHFVIEVFVPQLRRLPPGERFVPFHVGDHHIGVDEYDVLTQRLVSHHAMPARPFATSHHRWAFPAEYDLMARLAGLQLHGRWADWSRSPFTADSASHVSVWSRPASA